jgi:hypothetical protein
MCYRELSSQSDLRKAFENEKFIVSTIAILIFLMKIYAYVLKPYMRSSLCGLPGLFDIA